MVMEMDNAASEKGRMSVTLKSDGKDGTWIVFHGSATEIRKQIIETMGLDGEQDAPLFDLINEATKLYKSASAVSAGLGGRVINKANGLNGAGATGSAWGQPSGEQEAPVDLNVVRLTRAIEEETTVSSLKELYARNKVHFDGNAELMAAYKAKGKSLTPTA